MNQIIKQDNLKDKIFTMRGMQVMLDRDLAELYGVETRVLNQAVKRNMERFPEEFMFQMTTTEFMNWRSQFVTSSENSLRSQIVILDKGRGKHQKYLPYVFTEQGIAMLSAVLKSKVAINVSVQIMTAFVQMRKFVQNNSEVFSRIERLESGHTTLSEKIDDVLDTLASKDALPKRGVFYDNQIFDAHVFVSKIVRSAKTSLVLIDNFVDESVLQLLHKRKSGVKVTIYTKSISKALKQDLKKYNAQYKDDIAVKVFTKAHDRFLIIDDGVVYSIGASLKDLGKRWFAFAKFNKEGITMLEKLK